ncbi:MAG: hypothetical protein NVS3B26_27780 [Mycobacteriales bacterium]
MSVRLAAIGILMAPLLTVTGTATADPVGTGAHPWAVVLCNFQNQLVDPGGSSSLPFYQQAYTSAGAGAGKYNFVDWWHDVSFGQLNVAGTTVVNGAHADANGWYTVPESRDTWGYNRNRYGKIVDCANAALQDVNFHNFYGVITVFPEAQGKNTVALGAADTTMTLDTSSTSPPQTLFSTNYFPTVPFMMNLDDGSPGNAETVKVTAVAGNTFTIQRGVNGTTAKSHAANGSAAVPGDYGEVGNGSPVGTPPGQSNVGLSDGTYQLSMVVVPNENNLTGTAHETGHGNGYNHSRKLSYSTTDYKDATDVMSAFDGTYEVTNLGTTFGGSVLGSNANDKGPGLTADNLDFQGWIPAGRHFAFDNTTVPNQSTLTLHALSDPNALAAAGSEYLVAHVPATVTIENTSPSDAAGNPQTPTSPPTCSGAGFTCTTSKYYSIEYRQQIGWDSGFPASGVVLHLFGSDGRTYWVDSTPLGNNGLLYAGDEYVDAGNRTYVAVNAISGGTARVTLGSAKINPTFTYTGDATGHYTDATTLAGDLTVGGAPVPGKSVTLSLGSQSCDGTTDPVGHVSCSITLTQHPGSYTASGSFAGDSAYNSTSGSAPYTILPEITTITYNGATSQDYHDPATVSAVLTTDDGLAVAGKTVTFQIGSSPSDVCSALTDATGTASCTITPTQASGPYTMTAAFGGDGDYQPSSDNGSTFTVLKEETTTAYSGPTVILQGGSGVTLTGQLLEDGNPAAPISGRTLTLSLGTQSCPGTTDSAGVARCTLTFVGALGSQPLSAAFAGDAYYLPSADTSKTAVVFAFPSRGAFTLGDRTVAAASPSTSITWWADNWYQLNSLTGGTAPSSFKGFAATVALPTSTPPAACGGNWQTLPGNSPPPTAGVPSYMGVLVTSRVSKTGNSIAGNTTHIVVVRTDPGYAPDPQSHGTGTIVATYC